MFYDFLWWDPDPENLTGSGRIRILFNDNVIFQYFVTAESRFPTLAELVHHHSIHSDGLITQVISSHSTGINSDGLITQVRVPVTCAEPSAQPSFKI